MKKKISIVLTITVPFCLAAVLFLFYRFDPSDVPLFPKCIFHLLTGLECPGCGIQRALHHLLHGEFTEALRYNAVAVLVIIPYLSLFFLLRIIILVREWRGKQEREPREKMPERVFRCLYHGRVPYIVLVLILIFWILRNILPIMKI